MNRTMKTTVGLLAAAAMVVPLAACGGGSSSSSGDGKGSVYFLNFKPEAADQWKAVAAEYEKEKGVKVKVQTAASNTYEQQLKSELAKSEAPTIFQVNGPVGYQSWKAYTADLKDTAIYKDMNDQSLALTDGDKIVGVPYVIESYGIIYNKDIVAKYTALDGAVIKSADEIKDFDTLKKVADDMQKRKKDLGIEGAFTSAGFDASSDWRFKTHLANIPLYYQFKKDNITAPPASIKDMYMDNFKNIFDLYITDSTTEKTQLSSKTGDDASSEFALGKAAFYQNGTWAWSDLQKAGMKDSSVGMLPIYIGVDDKTEGLATGSENYWCINSKASEADQKASADFLEWVITSDEGKKAMSEDMGFTTPFSTFNDVKTTNPLIADANASIQNKNLTQVAWDFSMMPSEEYKNVLGQAMLAYAQGTGDWNAVVDAFVNNWATEYQATH
ncbi:ABC transporter substrate-binding protein [Bifidobacterium choerinum]|uniref:ABC transporter substrate-binding protein n=1 Tax=Bifidobacterium choerinum TaxID=35760 RepID=A0A087A6L5_9BIFI|nr:ABC transporter substrate-binding protein [Bifidobacterium choerinum]ATU19924.1 ABC transporter substrate-binding protein [Bifidobacterium choerinum]KFI54415.1 ABC transporter substrate-binding protein [Bifidobacterium choerinum]